MSSTHSKLLTLSLSRNRLAFAVFHRGQLDFYGGKTLRQYRSVRDRNRAFTTILTGLTLAHSISRLTLPRLNKQQRRSSDLRSLYRTAGRYCMTSQLPLQLQDPVQARRQLVGDLRPSKANARRHLIRMFPELSRYARAETEWEGRYYGHVFTAIGCGRAAIESERATR